MPRLLWWLRRRGRGAAMVAGVLLALAGAALQMFGTRDLEARLEAIEDSIGVRPAGPAPDLRTESPRMQLAAFYRHFERPDPVTDHLATLYVLARQSGLVLDAAEYRLQRNTDRKFDRYQVVLPLTGSYGSVRVFVTAALREIPTMSVDQLQFRRQEIGDSQIDAQVSLSFHLAR
jgi:hypothetical protein